MFALADVLHLLTHEFTGLSARRLTFPLIPAGPLDRSLLRHVNLQVHWCRPQPNGNFI